jgi:hypothetical protein
MATGGGGTAPSLLMAGSAKLTITGFEQIKWESIAGIGWNIPVAEQYIPTAANDGAYTLTPMPPTDYHFSATVVPGCVVTPLLTWWEALTTKPMPTDIKTATLVINNDMGTMGLTLNITGVVMESMQTHTATAGSAEFASVACAFCAASITKM